MEEPPSKNVVIRSLVLFLTVALLILIPSQKSAAAFAGQENLPVAQFVPAKNAHNAPQAIEIVQTINTPPPVITSNHTPTAKAQQGHFPPAIDALYTEFAQYDWPVSIAMAIASCESGGNAYAVSTTNDYGIFQIHDGLQNYGTDIFNPAFNIKIAYEHYYLTRGFEPWTTYRDGCYKNYL